jgi:ribosomal protein S18 acetylase RimI-like enzyme
MALGITGERAARAFSAFLDLNVVHRPGAWRRPGRNGTRLVSLGAPLATFNGVFGIEGEPRPADLQEYVTQAGHRPWSVFSRLQPSASLRTAAAAAGLVAARSSPAMVRATGLLPEETAKVVRVAGAAGRERYIDALAAGFGAPKELFDELMTEPLMKAPGVTSYLIEVDGEPVATGSGVVAEGLVGIYNIATLPEHRRRGYGRLATEAVMRDGFAAGVEGAYLMASDMGEHLYLSMGFETVENWSYLTAE